MAHGLAMVLGRADLTVVVNTADDFEHLGLHISPDLDTVCYTLAGLANPFTGWGQANETWEFLAALEKLGGEVWFRLGDRDLATHVERTRRLQAGETLTQVTRAFCRVWRVGPRVLPMSDDPVHTVVVTPGGELAFQDYFVRRGCEPIVSGFRFEGIETARPTPGILEAIKGAQMVVICPSNPWISVDPILAVPGIREALKSRVVVAVSPIVGGEAIKGPAARMYRQMGIEPGPVAVARHYGDLLAGLVIDRRDEAKAEQIEHSGVRVLVTDTIMQTESDRGRLAREVLTYSR